MRRNGKVRSGARTWILQQVSVTTPNVADVLWQNMRCVVDIH